jgi:hypothetical protein
VSPPTAEAEAGFGGSATPTKNHLIAAARLILDNCGIPFSNSRIYRLVIGFLSKWPNASGFLFFQHLASVVQMSEAQKRAAMSNPDIARAISYCDPTGETAVNNVLRRTR